MPIKKGTKSLPHSGPRAAAHKDRVATNHMIQARLNDGPRRKSLEKYHGKAGVNDDVKYQRKMGDVGRKHAEILRKEASKKSRTTPSNKRK